MADYSRIFPRFLRFSPLLYCWRNSCTAGEPFNEVLIGAGVRRLFSAHDVNRVEYSRISVNVLLSWCHDPVLGSASIKVQFHSDPLPFFPSRPTIDCRWVCRHYISRITHISALAPIIARQSGKGRNCSVLRFLSLRRIVPVRLGLLRALVPNAYRLKLWEFDGHTVQSVYLWCENVIVLTLAFVLLITLQWVCIRALICNTNQWLQNSIFLVCNSESLLIKLYE